VEPNSVIFLCLLSACGHCGIVDEGKGLFVSMPRFHGIMPMVEHFNCIVDMLGHLGCLDEAEEILKGMPFQCNVMGWISLLNSCKLYTNVPIGRRCFNQTITLDERIASVYLLMFSIYADANMPEAAHRIHEMKKDAFAQKVAGISCIDVAAEMHSFCVGDESHPLTELDLCMRS
jgi:pentatricopeptide repeat protein